MNKISWTIQVAAMEFYNKPGYQCPKCRTKIPFEGPPMLILATDTFADKCPDCGAYIVIDMTKGSPVIIEGFQTLADAEGRILYINSYSGTKGLKK